MDPEGLARMNEEEFLHHAKVYALTTPLPSRCVPCLVRNDQEQVAYYIYNGQSMCAKHVKEWFK